MFNHKSQYLLVLATILFIIFILLSQYIINEKIYKKDLFEDVKDVVNNKESILKDILYDGKYLAYSINHSLDLNELMQKTATNEDLFTKDFQSFFDTSYTISNITLLNLQLNEVAKYFSSAENISLNKRNIEKFLDSKNKEMLSHIYLNIKDGKIQVPYFPKVSYLKKIYKNEVLNGVLVIEYDLNYGLKDFFNNYRYDFILLSGKGETLYHYNDLMSWSEFLDREDKLDINLRKSLNSILTNEVFKSTTFHSYRLNIKIEDGLILVCKLKDEYLEGLDDLLFKRKISFLVTFIMATIIVLIIALIILEKDAKALFKAKKTSEELENIQKFSNLAQKIAKIGLWKIDSYNNSTWNKCMYKILEIKDDKTKISYESFISFVYKDDKERYEKEYNSSKNRKKENFITFRIVTTSGKIKWVEQRWKHYYNSDNKFIKTVGSLYDITNRKSIEDLLKLDNFELRKKIDSLPFGVVLIDLEMNIKYVNETFKDTLGYSQKDILRKKYFDKFLGEDKELFNLLLIDIQQKKFLDNQEFRFINRNGEIITSNISFKYDSRNREVLLTITDITTKIKEHEKYLINQSRLANLGEMLIDLTYQWRQPLSVISTSASFLKLEHEIDSQQKEETIDVLTKIIESSTRLSNRIDDFKYYVYDNAKESTFSVNDSIEKVLMILESPILQKEIEIVTDFDEDIEIKNVENSFMQVLVNIVKNSIEALGDYPKQKKLIIISTSILKDKLEVTVTDNAHGIDEKILPSVFNEYFTTKLKQKSTGLGLYIAKKIVSSKLKGSIIAQNKDFIYQNENYRGASFKISISLLNKDF